MFKEMFREIFREMYREMFKEMFRETLRNSLLKMNIPDKWTGVQFTSQGEKQERKHFH